MARRLPTSPCQRARITRGRGSNPQSEIDRRFDTVFAVMNRGGRLVSEARVDPGKRWAFGRVHLGVLQPGPQSAAGGPVHVLFHGELVNEAELQSILVEGGEGPADSASAIVEGLYRQDKQGFARLLKGSFCAAIIDDAAQTLVLVTDRLGSYPLYWFRTDDRLVFASELRAALRDHPRPTLNAAAVADFLKFGFPMGDKTLAAGVEMVPTASTLTYCTTTGAVHIDPYATVDELFSRADLGHDAYLEAVEAACSQSMDAACAARTGSAFRCRADWIRGSS